MKNKFKLSIYLLVSLFSGALYGEQSLAVNDGEIDNAYVYKHKDQENPVYLSSQEINELAHAIANSKNVGLCKYAVRLWLVVEMKNGIQRQFRINSNTIKESSDICYELQNAYGIYLLEKTHNK